MAIFCNFAPNFIFYMSYIVMPNWQKYSTKTYSIK